MKLYVHNIVREPKDTLYTFLNRVLKLDNKINGYFTLGTVNATYLDSEFLKLQCMAGQHRSFDDIVSISKTYFKVSNKAIAKVIKKLLDENDKLCFVLCDSAKKWVLNRDLSKSDIFKYCARYNDSPAKTHEYLNGNYSFNDIINLMGLTIEDIKIKNG